MSRVGAHQPRVLPPDPVYNSVLVTRLINRVMKNGKKTVARKLVYRALEKVEKDLKKPALTVLDEVITKLKPKMEVRSRRVGGTTYQVPLPVRPRRQETLAIRWLILGARTLPNKEYHTFADKLAAEMKNVLNQTGWSFNKKEEVERMAEANKAFAHFRW